MKNLKLLKKSICHIDNDILSVCLTNDIEDGLFCVTKENIILSSASLNKEIVSELNLNVKIIQNGQSIYCSSKQTIISYDNFTGTVLDQIDFDLNILTFSLCPDESMLLVLTDDLTFSILSNELEILSTFELEQCGFGSAKPTSVGWGKKETQFHGKLGKDSRLINEEALETSSFDTEDVFISWKDDGEYFAISWICRSNVQTNVNVGARLIRVFSKDGELFSTSEAINTLENGLFWRSKGGLITTSCRSNKGLEIIFIEQNGLRHGGFTLFDSKNCDNKVVSSIQFCVTFDICAVSIYDNKDDKTYVQLLSTNNYQWYLKQHIEFSGISPLYMLWNGDKMHLSQYSGDHYIYQWYEEVDRSLILEYKCVDDIFENSPNLVCVIDGKKLLVTPFGYCVIPPPFCAFTLSFDDYISFVSLPYLKNNNADYISCFVQFFNKNCMWIKLRKDKNENSILSVKSKNEKGKVDYQHIAFFATSLNFDYELNTLSWCDDESFYGVFGNNLYFCELKDNLINVKRLNHPGIEFANICQSDKIYVQSTQGYVYTFDNEATFMFKFSTFCQEMFCANLKSQTDSTIIGLSRRFNQLFINENLQPGSYLSALLLKSHVLFTNVNQKLRCISIVQNDLKDFIHMLDDKNYNSNCDFDETFRLIEPGTEIITCVPSDSKIILMMPRGNLETIYPRALILDELFTLMEQNMYSQCIEKMRRHRVNLNLVYDHNPQKFMDNLKVIISENGKNDRLVLLISELSNENVTETMYKRFYDCSQNNLTKDDNKINKICSEIIRIIENENLSEEYLFPILTCYVKMSPSRSDKALQLLCNFKNEKKSKLWEKGLRHLQYMISIDDLYRVAMSTYDLNLTLQVAQKTQLDPKEYVDFINDLTELPCENYRRYKINMFLKKYPLALDFLSVVADNYWDEFVELIKDHNLYVESLKLFKVGTKTYTIISSLYAEHLINKYSDFKAAGMVYLRSGDKSLCEKAADCFFKQLSFNEWLIATKSCEMNNEQLSKELQKFASVLHSRGKHQESMLIYETYLNDLDNAFNVSLDGFLFFEVFRIKSRMSLKHEEIKANELNVKIDMAVTKEYSFTVAELEEMLSSFTDNVSRLVIVRNEFVKKYNETKDDGEDDVLPDYMSDTMSDASSLRSVSSMGSYKSNTSQRSNMSKKISKKKLWSDKLGSQKEEIGIMEKLNSNIKTGQTMSDKVKQFAEVLSYVNKVNESRTVTDKYNALLEAHYSSILIIWDNFVFDRTYELSEYEFPISNHIKVSRGPKFAGRRRYMIDEEFLRYPPKMNANKLAYSASTVN